MRTVQSVLGNSQKLDGGAMYGNCPRALWSRWSPPDDRDRIDLACRAMLVREPNRLLLFETGIGAFFSPALRERFGVVEEQHVLLENLSALGITTADIDVVVLSHLHFDHAGGLLASYSEGQPEELLFPSARYLVGQQAFDRAIHPHSRDRASFIPALQGLLTASGRLELCTGPTHPVLGDGYRFHYSDGHTPGLLLTEVTTDDYGPLLFASDLIPGVPWVHLPITMGYDRYPELLIDEKQALLADLLARTGALFFTHDPKTAIGRVTRDEKGKFGVTPLT